MQKKKKTGTRISGTRIRPEYSGIYRVVLALYPSRIRSYTIRVLPVSVSEKTCICTIRIRYPAGIPDPFSPPSYQPKNRKRAVITPGKMCNHLKGIFEPMSNLPRATTTPGRRRRGGACGSPTSFLNLSIDAPTVHLFKLIDCLFNFQYGANLLVHHSI
jgi:hypothetical protein